MKPNRAHCRHAKLFTADVTKQRLSHSAPACHPSSVGKRFAATGGRALGQLVFLVKIDPAVYSRILRDLTVSHGAFRLWHLLRDMHGNNGYAWPGTRFLQRSFRCGSTTLLKWIAELEAAGYLRTERGNVARASHYFIMGALKSGAGVLPSQEQAAPIVRARPAPEAGAKPNSLEPNSRTNGSRPRLFAREIKEIYKAKRDMINSSPASYEVERFRTSDGSVYTRRGAMKKEASDQLRTIDLAEREQTASLA